MDYATFQVLIIVYLSHLSLAYVQKLVIQLPILFTFI